MEENRGVVSISSGNIRPAIVHSRLVRQRGWKSSERLEHVLLGSEMDTYLKREPRNITEPPQTTMGRGSKAGGASVDLLQAQVQMPLRHIVPSCLRELIR